MIMLSQKQLGLSTVAEFVETRYAEQARLKRSGIRLLPKGYLITQTGNYFFETVKQAEQKKTRHRAGRFIE